MAAKPATLRVTTDSPWRSRLVTGLTNVLAAQAPAGVEVVSLESAHRDRMVKLRKYAEAGIPHYWLVEDEATRPVVHVYELDVPARAYAPAGIFRETLSRTVPFDVMVQLTELVRR